MSEMGHTLFEENFSRWASARSSWAWPNNRSVRFRAANKSLRGPPQSSLGTLMQAVI